MYIFFKMFHLIRYNGQKYIFLAEYKVLSVKSCFFYFRKCGFKFVDAMKSFSLPTPLSRPKISRQSSQHGWQLPTPTLNFQCDSISKSDLWTNS